MRYITQSDKKNIIKKIILILLTVVIIGGMVTYEISRELSLALYDPALLIAPREDIVMYDGNLNEFNALANREYTVPEKLPQHLKNAIISIEDKKFYKHNGVDYIRIIGAAYQNVKTGKITQGGSTISQQLIKNTHLNNDKKMKRKIKEYFLAQKLEQDYSKDEILNMYANAVYFGNGTYGAANASKMFFNKNYYELNLEECAVLAAVLNSPKLYSPFNSYDNSLKRRNLVLNQMYSDGKITRAEHSNASKTEIILNANKNSDDNCALNNCYYLAALEEARELLDNPESISGYKIYTNYNKDLQKKLSININNEKYLYPNDSGKIPDAQGIIINNSNGKIEAYYTSNIILNRLERQPASAIKPILVYAPAIENGIITPATQILDEEINYGGYSPKNHNNKFSGYVSVRNALSNSLNIPAVKILDYVGIDNAKEFANRAGINFDKKDNGYALALGGFTKGVTLTALANTYQCLGNQGKYVKAGMIDKIVDNKGKIVYQNPYSANKIMGEDTAYLIGDMLKTSVKNGTAFRLNSLGFDVAAKTGTAGNPEGNTDAYCIAYTLDHTFAVWQGNIHSYKNNMDTKVNGGSYPAMQLRDILKSVYKKRPADFVKPGNIVELEIDADELKLKHKLFKSDKTTTNKLLEKFSTSNMPFERINNNVLPEKSENEKTIINIKNNTNLILKMKELLRKIRKKYVS